MIDLATGQLGSTAVGLKTKEGVVLAVEKRITSVPIGKLLSRSPSFQLPYASQ